MKLMNNLIIKNKLLLGFTILLTFVVIMIFVAFKSLSTMRETQRTLTTIEYPLSIELLKLRTGINRERIAINRLVMTQNIQGSEQWRNELHELDTNLIATIDTIKVLAKNNPQLVSGLKRFTVKRENFLLYRDTLLYVYNTSKTHAKAVELMYGAMFDLNENMRDDIVELSKISEENNDLLKQKTESAYSNVVVSFAVFGILLIIICLFLTFLFVNIIGKPIQELSKQAEQIAYGNLSVKINVRDGNDEVVVMQRSFGMMLSSLRSVSEELKSTVATLDNLSSEIKKEFNAGFNDTAALLKWMEKFSVDVSAISQRLNLLMNEFKL